METHEAGKGEKFFQDFGKKLDQFVIEAKEASARMEGELKAKYEELREAAERLKRETENKERWKEAEESLKKAASEIEKAFSTMFKKKESE